MAFEEILQTGVLSVVKKPNQPTENVWRVVIVTLTDATSDQIKLALLEVVDSMGPGFTENIYVTTRKEFFGCAFNAKVVMRVVDFDDARRQIIEALERHGVGFLSMIIRPHDDATEGSCVICHGNIPREKTSVDQGPYRSLPNEK